MAGSCIFYAWCIYSLALHSDRSCVPHNKRRLSLVLWMEMGKWCVWRIACTMIQFRRFPNEKSCLILYPPSVISLLFSLKISSYEMQYTILYYTIIHCAGFVWCVVAIACGHLPTSTATRHAQPNINHCRLTINYRPIKNQTTQCCWLTGWRVRFIVRCLSPLDTRRGPPVQIRR